MQLGPFRIDASSPKLPDIFRIETGSLKPKNCQLVEIPYNSLSPHCGGKGQSEGGRPSGKGIYHPEKRKTAEIPVSGDKFVNSVFQTEGGDMGIMD